MGIMVVKIFAGDKRFGWQALQEGSSVSQQKGRCLEKRHHHHEDFSVTSSGPTVFHTSTSYKRNSTNNKRAVSERITQE